MTTALEPRTGGPAPTAIEQALIGGDLSRLNTEQRLAYYNQVCESLGLNPLTKPFDYINLNGKLTLYAKRDATDQLRSKKHVSIEITARTQTGDLYIVQARATMPDGRTDESLGAVSTTALKGEALANAIMKAETKAKRRATLSICGLGWLDETEVASITEPPTTLRPQLQAPQRKSALPEPDDPLPSVNTETGEIGDEPTITEPQRKRLWAIAKDAGWQDAEIKSYLSEVHGIQSTKDVPKRLYDIICAALAMGVEKAKGESC